MHDIGAQSKVPIIENFKIKTGFAGRQYLQDKFKAISHIHDKMKAKPRGHTSYLPVPSKAITIHIPLKYSPVLIQSDHVAVITFENE